MLAGRSRWSKQAINEWFLRQGALAAARAQLLPPGTLAGRALEQARLLREVARQVAEPIDQLPKGRPSAVQLSLYRDLVYWLLVATLNDEHDVPPNLPALWRQIPGDTLLRAAKTAENLDAVRYALLDLSPLDSLNTTAEDAERVHHFADVLYWEMEEPRRRVGRIVTQRWVRLAAVLVLTVVAAFAVRALVLGPNLATRRPLRTSSTLPGCEIEPKCAGLLFHTQVEENPWVEFDLGGTKPIHRIDVVNRPDCCQERAVPLIVEVSDDRIHWKEIARNTTAFSTWTAKFPRTPAAYVKLRGPHAV